jgi:hypothetical protein
MQETQPVGRTKRGAHPYNPRPRQLNIDHGTVQSRADFLHALTYRRESSILCSPPLL